jgi:hypothetical protein
MKEIAIIVYAICAAAVGVEEIRKDGGGCLVITALWILYLCLAALVGLS